MWLDDCLQWPQLSTLFPVILRLIYDSPNEVTYASNYNVRRATYQSPKATPRLYCALGDDCWVITWSIYSIDTRWTTETEQSVSKSKDSLDGGVQIKIVRINCHPVRDFLYFKIKKERRDTSIDYYRLQANWGGMAMICSWSHGDYYANRGLLISLSSVGSWRSVFYLPVCANLMCVWRMWAFW